MPMTLLPLSTLCVNVLLQNHTLLSDLGEVRYPLIKRVLLRLSAQQLMKLEAKNPLLVFDDGDVWDGLIRKDFPLETRDKYTTDKVKIRKFYQMQMNEFGLDHTAMNLDHHIKVEQVEVGRSSALKKYKLPYKLVYLKLEQDYRAKEEMAIENLRRKKAERSKEKNEVIQLNEVIATDNFNSRKRFLPAKSSQQHRSKLFQKAHVEAKKHQENFRNPVVEYRTVRKPQTVLPLRSPVLSPSSAGTQNEKRASPPLQTLLAIPVTNKPQTSTTLIKSPIKSKTSKQVSIFHTRRKPSAKRKKSPMDGSSLNTPSAPSPLATPQAFASPPMKRIKLGEYLARNSK